MCYNTYLETVDEYYNNILDNIDDEDKWLYNDEINDVEEFVERNGYINNYSLGE